MLPETPCLLIDELIVDRNIQRMSDIARNYGVNLRPHAKTHKLPYMSRKQLEAGAVGITVAKVGEAEVMVEHGIRDIFIAYPIIVPSKIKRLIALGQSANIMVGVDSLVGARRLSDEATQRGHTIQVRMEIDTGLNRTGVSLDEAAKLAYDIHTLPNLELTGIYTFRGAMLHGKPALNLREAGHEEGNLMVELTNRLQKQGIAIRDVSVGSTPTSAYAAEIRGVTEVRPGTYIYNDQMQVQMGVCMKDDCAAWIEVTVVSKPTVDRIVIDGGSKTFATDVQPGGSLNLQGFGRIIGHPDTILERMNEEHGMITGKGVSDIQIGDRIRVIPNHICSTINLHNSVYIHKNRSVIKEMPVLGRGKLS
ncbi:amino acid aldolase [Paenibacillus sp. SYP-B3998]|uniref:Amino acid aldolase n=1 Tax=Paenibacillus sp. SYP-B3998 TaxID=2678564 RepID=A0A6G3ZXI2_9BACL|nr:alanine racemase [Paenibacillus sp. SYP-B3998]NEW06790.1 amino acid aldolase [Paenibacillus sp. SYP-B3998]